MRIFCRFAAVAAHVMDQIVIEIVYTTPLKAGLLIKDMQHYIALALKGESTLQERYEIFLEQEKVLKHKIEVLQNAMEVTQKKLAYYKTAIESGSEKDLPLAFNLSRSGSAVKNP